MPPSALEALFDAEGETLAIQGGEELFAVGAAPEGLYRVKSGRLAITQPVSRGGSRLVDVCRPGEIIGAGPMITGQPYDNAATALRDSELQRLTKAQIDAVGQHTDVYAALARTALEPDTQVAGATTPRRASILGFVAVCDSVAMREMAEGLAVEMRGLGFKIAVLGRDYLNTSAATLSRLEDEHDFLIMSAERAEGTYTAFLGRQIDRLILVGGAESPLPEIPFSFAALAIHRHQLLDLVIVHPADALRPHETARWLAGAPSARLFHVRRELRADITRLARIFTGRSVGLALSGGGARAYAHIGVARAMQELGVPLDFLAGTSMGGVVAAGLAMGWSLEELDRRIRQAFVETSPLSDIAFPFVAMSRGSLVDARLKAHFGGVQICDLWRPFTCVSTDLTTGDIHVHRTGPLDRALRATVSLPGVLPPVIENGHVLVDGALARNLPVDLINEQHDGFTIGVDVAHANGLTPQDLKLQPSGLRWLTSGAWRRGPPIISVLIRAATMPTRRAMAASRECAEMIIQPDLEGIELRNWKAYEPAVEAGYRATMARAGELKVYSVNQRVNPDDMATRP